MLAKVAVISCLLFSICHVGSALVCFECGGPGCLDHYNDTTPPTPAPGPNSMVGNYLLSQLQTNISNAKLNSKLQGLGAANDTACYTVLFHSDDLGLTDTYAIRTMFLQDVVSRGGCEWIESLLNVVLIDVESCSSCTEDYCNSATALKSSFAIFLVIALAVFNL